MKKILVAYDGDGPAHRALERGAESTQSFGAELGVVSVTPWRRGRFLQGSVSEHLATNAKATVVIAR